MKILSISCALAVGLALASCSDANETEAKKLGFADAATMQQVQAKGWHTNAQYVADETARAKNLGFSSFDELVEAETAGYHDPESYRTYKIEETKKAAVETNDSAGTAESNQTNNAASAPEDQQSIFENSIVPRTSKSYIEYCQDYAEALKQCSTAANMRDCMEIQDRNPSAPWYSFAQSDCTNQGGVRRLNF